MKFLCKIFGHKREDSAFTELGPAVEQECEWCGVYRHHFMQDRDETRNRKHAWRDGQHPNAEAARQKTIDGGWRGFN